VAEPPVDRFMRRQHWMDGVAEFLQGLVAGAYRVLGRPGRFLKDLMHGTWPLGHPLHPAVTDIPIGAWAVAVVADFTAHFTVRLPAEAGDVAVAVGLVAALLAALTGYTDFSETFGQERRFALSHGLIMTAVVALEAASMGLRWWGPASAHALAVGLSTAGFVVLLFGAYLGGHLVFRIGTMVNRNAFAEGPDDYVPIGAPGDFSEGALARVMAGPMPVVVVRRGGSLHALAATCSHAGGPLDEGTLEGDVVVCPWHASRFRVSDGKVRGGPATFPQTALLVREVDGRVEVKLEAPLH
jgi:nitrite reductase/ring-hydroxylating ferredoxin subunit/uncharacterized membrane protein